MLDLFRKNSRSFLIYLMFAVIILVFAFTFGAITPDQACGGGGQYQVVDLAKVGHLWGAASPIRCIAGAHFSVPCFRTSCPATFSNSFLPSGVKSFQFSCELSLFSRILPIKLRKKSSSCPPA
jgi:hypothetical protein